LQSAETVAPDTAEEWALPPSPPRPHASLRAWLVLAALLLSTGLAGWGVWLTWLRPGPTPIDAVVIGQTKPVLAPAEGQLSHILVAPGDRVASRTDLFEIAPRPADPKIRAELTARLELARSRQIRFGLRIQELNSLVLRAAAVPDLASQREAEQGRMRLRDVQDQAVSTAEEVALLEQSLSGETKRPASATLVRAERHGVLTRIQAVEGMDVVPGLQLAEIVDCAALSLSVDGAAAAAAGFSSGRKITVQMPGRRVGEGVFTVLVPDAAERAKGAEFGRSNGRLILPVDLTVWERAGGEVCPIGNRVSVQAR
jgi:multidrug resistance efflux pump